MRDGRHTGWSGPLPLEARRGLWQQLWDRLLAPPLEPDEEVAPQTDEDEDPPTAPPIGEGGR